MSKVKSMIINPDEIATCIRFLPDCSIKKENENETLLASAHLDGTVNIYKTDRDANQDEMQIDSTDKNKVASFKEHFFAVNDLDFTK
jgi:hypothetical protein